MSTPYKDDKRSWSTINSATGQYQYRTFEEPLPHCEKNMTAVLDTAKFPSDDDYEDPELQVIDGWPSVKILPARPIKESEYADTRYFKGAVDGPSPWHIKPSTPPTGRTQNTWLQLEEDSCHPAPFAPEPWHEDWATVRSGASSRLSQPQRAFQLSKGTAPPLCGFFIKHQRASGGIKLKRGPELSRSPQIPLVPNLPENHGSPRAGPPPTVLKKYQPLPPLPWESHTPALEQHTFPEGQREPRQISLKDLSEALGEEKGQKGSMQSHSPRRCPPPASCGPAESTLPSGDTGWRKPFPPRSGAKDVQHNEWYIGEYSRQVVEEALMQENKDGTFLVRDCSTKSMAEPYVLVVFHGNKVYNVKIRFLERNQKFALGTGLRGDEKFDSVEDIIEHYKCFPITLIDGKDKSGVRREQCYLTQPLPLARRFSPW
ncbi:Cytokine-dependent hematopoietic cell linker [Heterocephalus glaber]|uniref:Cytokine-dependent hematopoietic cell linker n=1 Tax=Heterocephalus glaber TaxID=10181 RepID=G5B2Y4_HETGA|nr:Cytokine-dependent hematopoietic cell linker [Heterocephalus glaber]